MVVSATISSSPPMVYFGQEVGEDGSEDAGFGKRSRTSIFDYIGVPAHQRWMNGGAFDGGDLSQPEKDLRDFYKRLLNFTLNSSALSGEYREIQTENRQEGNYPANVYSFVRWSADEKLVITTNFSTETQRFELLLPGAAVTAFGLEDGIYRLTDQLYGKAEALLTISGGIGKAEIALPPSGSYIFKVARRD